MLDCMRQTDSVRTLDDKELKMNMKKRIGVGFWVVILFALVGCGTQANRVNQNIVNEADSFNLYRRVAVINLLDNEPLFELTGFFSLEDTGDRITVTVQTGPDSFQRHMINVNEFVFWIVEDLNQIEVSPYTHTIIIQPEMFRLFDVDVRN